MVILHCYFDESGKFKEHDVVSFCGLVTLLDDLKGFNDEWEYLLRRNGLTSLSMKHALKHRRPLSRRNIKTGLDNRITDLMPFAELIRQHFEFGVGVAFDVQAFKGLPSHAQSLLGNDTHYAAFERSVHELVRHVAGPGAYASMVLDDEEKYSKECYDLLIKMKLAYPDVREKIVSIAFADDKAYPALQAADMLSSLTRLESQRRFFGTEYEYVALYNFLVKELPAKGKILFAGGLYSTDGMMELAKKLSDAKRGRKPITPLRKED